MATLNSNGSVITFYGVQDLKNYIDNNTNNTLSGKTIILNSSNQENTSIENNFYTLDDILGSSNAGFSQPVNIEVGSGVTLSDQWNNVEYTPGSTDTYPNISSITLDKDATLQAGNPSKSLTGILDKTNIQFSNNVDADHPAYIDLIFTPNAKNSNKANINQQNLHFKTKNNPNLIGYQTNKYGPYTYNNYDAQKSGIQFRVIDNNQDYPPLNQVKYNGKNPKNPNFTLSSNSGFDKANVIVSGGQNTPNLQFDVPLFDQMYYHNTTPDQFIDILFNNNTPIEYPCFYQGSEIETIYGWKRVENIQIGDEVIAYVNGKKEFRKVIWTGSTSLSKTKKNNTLIKIEQNALRDNIPSKDLYITPEHCLYIDHCFVPARMLVNNRSIYEVSALTNSFIYHIELEKHSIINAHNVMTESYLDTNNTYIGKKSQKETKYKSWEKDAAAPLNVARAFVEPIFRQIETRAIALNITQKKNIQSVKITQDPEIQLLTQDLQPLSFHKKDKKLYVTIPSNTDLVYIKSKASKPSEVIGPFVDDRRDLGLLIGKISYIDNENYEEIHIPINNNNWYVSPNTHLKWTNGLSDIPLNKQNKETHLIIEIIDYNTGYIEY